MLQACCLIFHVQKFFKAMESKSALRRLNYALEPVTALMIEQKRRLKREKENDNREMVVGKIEEYLNTIEGFTDTVNDIINGLVETNAREVAMLKVKYESSHGALEGIMGSESAILSEAIKMLKDKLITQEGFRRLLKAFLKKNEHADTQQV